jgi:zeaxanthin glucosyltransferase
VQLVLAVGPRADQDQLRELPGQPLVVASAPELLRRAALVITPADLNAVLDCISQGVPVVAIPVLFDQPGVAARVSWAGTGEVVPLRYADPATIRRAVQAVLADAGYRQRSQAVQAQLPPEGGAARAVAIIEATIRHAVPQAAPAALATR